MCGEASPAPHPSFGWWSFPPPRAIWMALAGLFHLWAGAVLSVSSLGLCCFPHLPKSVVLLFSFSYRGKVLLALPFFALVLPLSVCWGSGTVPFFPRKNQS